MDKFCPLKACIAEQSADFRLHFVAASWRNLIDLGDRDGRLRNTKKIKNFHMLDGLRHDAVVGSDHNKGMIHIADSRQHVLDKALMARHVDEAYEPAIRQRHIRKAEIDGETARLLLRQPICVDAG